MSKQWTSTAGPRQTKEVDDAIRALMSWGRGTKRIYDSGPVMMTALGAPVRQDCVEAMEKIGDQYEWKITRENFRQVIKAHEDVRATLHLPVEDLRTTPEQREANARAAQEREAAENKRQAQRDARAAVLRAKMPSWANAAIVAECREDESDMMTDYHGHRTTRHVLIGWRRGKREDFKQMRAAAGRFNETKHLGIGCDSWRVLEWLEREGDLSDHRPSRWWDLWEGEGEASHRVTSWPTEAEAKAAADAAIARGELMYGYDVQCTSVEHRENYSMGGGYYLGEGRNSGWVVRSYELGRLCECEDGLPVIPPMEAVTPEAGGGVGVGDLGAWCVEKHRHTKHGWDYWIVVLEDRVERDVFERLRASCEVSGGWYSRQWGKVPGGFAWKEEGAAEKWAQETLGEVAATA